MEFILILLIFGSGFMLGEFAALWRMRKLMLKIADSHGVDLIKEIGKLSNTDEDDDTEIAILKVEKIQDILYLYYRNDEEFVCQGTSMEELALLAKKYKNIEYATVVHDKQIFMFNDGKVKEYIHES